MEGQEEGTKAGVLVNRYERNRKNRELCIEAHKAVCSVCGFDFSRIYGEIGKGYIHVHHLNPLAASKGKLHKVDPVKDLRPVCPNFHEMLHRIYPPYTIEQLQKLIENTRAGVPRP
jgi:5-methylcytosine-specific restriction protein A